MEILDYLGVMRNVYVANPITVRVLIPLMVIIIWQAEGKLLGDHICETKITVPQKVLNWELRNRTGRSYKWCMNVPPRCSVYSTKLVNETIISVINVTKSVESCCPGFREQNNICISAECHNCQNGLCISGSCICQAGWEGPRCDSRVPISTTSSEISFTASEFSTIMTSPFLITTSNEKPIRTTDDHQDFMTSAPNKPLLDDRLDEGFISTTLGDVSSTNSKTHSTTSSSTTTNKNPILEEFLNLFNQYRAKTTQNPNNDDVEGSGSRIKHYYSTEHVYFDSTLTPPSHFIEDDEVATFEDPIIADEKDDYKEVDRDIFALNSSLNAKSNEDNNIIEKLSTTTLKPMITSTKSAEENAILKENSLKNTDDDFMGGRYEKRSSTEHFGENTKLTVVTEPASKNLIYSICAASLTTFLMLVVAVTVYAVRNSRRKLEKSKTKKDDVATVAVYTTSIFHSPLPDPPTFDNPTYLASGIDKNGWDRRGIKNETVEVQEFNVVFQKPIINPQLDAKQYLYDHPPSTGSYRASSQVDALSQYNFSQKSMPDGGDLVLEPLYDEIPSKDILIVEDDKVVDGKPLGGDHQKPNAIIDTNNCLYVNTCGRTKF